MHILGVVCADDAHVLVILASPADPCGSRRPRHLRAVRFHRIVGSLRSVASSKCPSPGQADGQEKGIPAHPAQAS